MRKTPTQMALAALSKIEEHERECSARWVSTEEQMVLMRQTLERHGERWEKLSWLICGTVLTGVLAIVLDGKLF